MQTFTRDAVRHVCLLLPSNASIASWDTIDARERFFSGVGRGCLIDMQDVTWALHVTLEISRVDF